MSVIYEAIGRAVVTVIRVRYRKQLRVAGVIVLAAVIATGYALSSRDVEEG